MTDKPLSMRLLYVEDNPVDADLVRRGLARLEPGCHLTVVNRVAAALAALRPSPPPFDLLLVDLRLPDGSGLEVLTAVKERNLPVAVVLLTGSGSQQAAIAALKAGADDYLVKDGDYLANLPATLTRALAHCQNRVAGTSLHILYGVDRPAEVDEVRHHLLEHAPHVKLEGVVGGRRVAERLLAGADEVNYDALLLDFQLAEVGALELVKRLRDHPELDLPVVLVSEPGNEQEVAEAMRLGVADYLIRQPGYLYGLPATLGQAVHMARLRREKAALLASENRLRQIEEKIRLQAAALEASQDGVVITDLQASVVSVNPAFTTITGYTEAEVVGKNPRLLQSGRHDRAFFQAMWAALKEQGHWQGEVWNRRKDGEVYPELLTISTVYDAGGKPAHYVGVKTDLTRLRRSEEKLQHLAHHDPLTGLPNRLLLEARLEHGLARAKRYGGKLAVLMVNLDRFRAINDSHGYGVGDRLLAEVARRLGDTMRDEDTLARLAGDEFVLVLENLHTYEEAETMARRLQRALEQPIDLPGGHEVFMRISLGVGFYPQDGDTATALLAGADLAVHQAKRAGGNRLMFATSDFNDRARRTLELETALRRALRREELVLYYQPKVDLRRGRLIGAEALIRWRRPGQGLVPPGEFIPVAERSDLIAELGAWVIEEACRQLRCWREAGLGHRSLAVNVSARQFQAGDLKKVVRRALERHEVPAHLLTLELTESMLMLDPEEAIARMRELKELGLKLALDDFGTGYSSFSSLSRFPIDQLKIDRSFINEIVTSPNAANIAVSIIAMARRMGLTVVAEGVETEAQCGYLRQNSCDQIQGFLFSRPLPPEEFTSLLRSGRGMTVPDEPAEARTLLIVDDEPHVIGALQRLLLEEDYRVLTATDAAVGLELLARHSVQVVISDQRMPGQSGTEFLSRVKDIYPDTVRMVLSGYADLETVVEAVNEGALYKFLTKPWKDELLLQHIREAFLHYEMIIKPRHGQV